MITTLLLVALASPPPPPPAPGQKWAWDGVNPRTLTLVGGSPSPAVELPHATAMLADCWGLSWDVPAQPKSAFGEARRW